MTPMKISARKLLSVPLEVVWEKLRGEFTLVMDDGEIQTNHKDVAYSRIFWEFIAQYPDTPLLLRHHYSNVDKNGAISASTHRNMFNAVFWDVLDTYRHRGVKIGDLTSLVYKINSRHYNLLVSTIPAYMGSLDFMDFIEILNDPDIVESQKDLHNEPRDTNRLRNQKIIEDVTDTIKQVFKENRYPNNTLSKITRAKLVRAEQVYQGIGVRGYLTDIGSDIFAYPIMTGFVRGMNKFHDVLIESRSAAKSLFFSKTPLQDAEYFSRKLQILTQTIKNLHPGDCGSTNYQPWLVRGEKYAGDGTVEYKGDLHTVLLGKYYLDESTNTLKAITKSDTHLIGKVIKLRSPIGGCNHPDPYGVCSVCFGSMAEVVPPNTNLGQTTSTSMTGKTSQLVLSVKHYDGTSVIEPIKIDSTYTKFVKPSRDNNSYILNGEYLEDKLPILVIQQKYAQSLPDILDESDVTMFNITSVSEIAEIGIRYTTWKGELEIVDTEVIPVNMGKRLSSFTHEFLEYIKKVGWSTDANQNYLVNLEEWNFEDPILSLPFRHINMSDFSNTISSVIESRVQVKKKRNETTSPQAALIELSDLINSKLDINLCVTEIILLATMTVSENDNNYNIPKPGQEKELGVLAVTIPNRSLSGALAFKDHKTWLTSPSSFFNRNRPSHPMDVFVMPKETVDHFQKVRRNNRPYTNVITVNENNLTV